MHGKRYETVFAAFTLNYVKHLAVEIQITQAHISNFHAAKTAAVKQSDKHAVFEQRGVCEHCPNFLLAQYHGDFLFFGNGRKVQVLVRQSFGFKQKTKTVNGVFEITLGRSVVLFLEQIEIILYLIRFQLGGQAAEVKRYGRHVP